MTKLRQRFATVALSAVAVVTTAGGLGGLGTVMADAAEAEVAPIAKYEFKDASNFGKDTMGNYDMSYRNAWLQGGTGPLMDKGTLIEGGGVQFSGEFCVAQDQDNNIFSDVTAFTLAFELKTETATVDWAHYIGVGNGNNGKDKTEGGRYKNVFGTYLHGSFLPKNPHFADYMIELALEKRYEEKIPLKKLDDKLELQTHNSLIGKAY